jgi:hypothetical protein
MVKPIPVFEFAFAAYAATARGSIERVRPGPERQPFDTVWRSTAGGDGALLVKIGVLDNGRAEATVLSPCETLLPVKEIWLGQIQEIDGGYSGVVCMSQGPLRSIGPGQPIEFGPAHILDWTISYEASPTCAVLREREKAAKTDCESCAGCESAEKARG